MVTSGTNSLSSDSNVQWQYGFDFYDIEKTYLLHIGSRDAVGSLIIENSIFFSFWCKIC